MKTDLETSHKQYVAKQHEHIEGLKTHITKLQTEIQTSESLRMREADQSQSAIHEMERKESSFGQERQAIKGGYDIRIRSLQTDLSRAKAELENVQQEKYDMECKKESHIEGLETDLRQQRQELEHLENRLREEQQRYEVRLTSDYQ